MELHWYFHSPHPLQSHPRNHHRNHFQSHHRNPLHEIKITTTPRTPHHHSAGLMICHFPSINSNQRHHKSIEYLLEWEVEWRWLVD